MGPGSVVLTTPYTFAATAEVVRYLGADPVFVDIDARHAEHRPRRRSRRPWSELQAAGRARFRHHSRARGGPSLRHGRHRIHLSRRYGVPVVEDAAHAFPVRQRGTVRRHPAATPGSTPSTRPRPITTGEGGMVVTDRDEVARRIRIMRLHGIDRDVWNRYTDARARRGSTTSWRRATSTT